MGCVRHWAARFMRGEHEVGSCGMKGTIKAISDVERRWFRMGIVAMKTASWNEAFSNFSNLHGAAFDSHILRYGLWRHRKSSQANQKRDRNRDIAFNNLPSTLH